MLVFGAANQAWEMLSSLQRANAGAAAGGVGLDSFIPDPTSPTAAPTAGTPSIAPPTGTTGQASLSPNVLGFLIWNQSQQPGVTPWATGGPNPAGTDGTPKAPGSAAASQTDSGDVPTWAPVQSWFSPFTADGSGNIGSPWPNPGFGGNGSASPAVTWQSQPDTNQGVAASGPDVPQSSGAHGHDQFLGLVMQTQSDQSDPLANLLGASAQGASSTIAANPDGSTTTTITYADGSEVTLTTAPQASTANPSPIAGAAAQLAFDSNNFLEILIQLQARLLTATGAA
jgi:hypothetical protein